MNQVRNTVQNVPHGVTLKKSDVIVATVCIELDQDLHIVNQKKGGRKRIDL